MTREIAVRRDQPPPRATQGSVAGARASINVKF
jgi:hypothetical protein